MRIRWSGQANRDLNEAFDYLADLTVRGQLTLARRIEARMRQLGAHPELGTTVSETGVRMLVVTRTDYLIYYRVEAEEIIVLRMRHGAQERLDFLDD